MIVGSLFKISFDSLLANKLRSGLTLLGVVVGVTSVMTIISAIEGFMGAVENQLDRLGPSTFVIATMGGVITSHEQFLEMQKRKEVKISDVSYITDGCDLCEKICPRAFSRTKIKYRGNSMNNIMVMGCTYNFLDIVDFEVNEGRFHTQADDLHSSKVVFVGYGIKDQLFEGRDPIGKYIRVKNIKYEIIGIAKEQGSLAGRSLDDFVVIPLSAHLKQFGKPNRITSNILVKAVSVEKLPEAMDQVRMALRSLRKVPYNKPDNFVILTADAVLEQFNQVTSIFRMTLVGVSSISLLVGGIVVMNIMMVSVTERTREIGIRKAVGARRNHILVQFMIESMITTLSGGVLGIFFGHLIASYLMSMIDMVIEPSVFAIVSGIFISSGIGLFFGIYPAMKASQLTPVKALSYET